VKAVEDVLRKNASGSSKCQMVPSLLALPASFFKVLPLPQKFNRYSTVSFSSFHTPGPQR